MVLGGGFWDSVPVVIAAPLIAALATLLTFWGQQRSAHSRWLREQRLPIYVGIAGAAAEAVENYKNAWLPAEKLERDKKIVKPTRKIEEYMRDLRVLGPLDLIPTATEVQKHLHYANVDITKFPTNKPSKCDLQGNASWDATLGQVKQNALIAEQHLKQFVAQTRVPLRMEGRIERLQRQMFSAYSWLRGRLRSPTRARATTQRKRSS